MGANTKKTGLADQVRAAMKKRRKPFTPIQIAKALELPPGPKREAVAKVIGDFHQRGEVERVGQSERGYLYRYNRKYKRPERPANLKRKVLKAIRYAGMKGAFTTEDVLFRAGVSKSHIHKILRNLENRGFVEVAGQKNRELSYGLENMYQVTDDDRFRRELL